MFSTRPTRSSKVAIVRICPRPSTRREVSMLSALSRLTLTLGVFAGVTLSPAAAADVETYLPDDTEAVVHVNVRQILDSPVFQKYGAAKLTAALDQHPEVGRFLAAAGIEPRKDVATLVVADTGTTAAQVLVVLHGTFDTARIHKAIE